MNQFLARWTGKKFVLIASARSALLLLTNCLYSRLCTFFFLRLREYGWFSYEHLPAMEECRKSRILSSIHTLISTAAAAAAASIQTLHSTHFWYCIQNILLCIDGNLYIQKYERVRGLVFMYALDVYCTHVFVRVDFHKCFFLLSIYVRNRYKLYAFPTHSSFIPQVNLSYCTHFCDESSQKNAEMLGTF